MLGRWRVRPHLTTIDILFDPVVDETSPRPIDLDKEVICPSNPFIIVDIPRSIRSIDDDLRDLVIKSRQFIEDLEWAIISNPKFEKCLIIVDEVLSRAVSFRSANKATYYELETQLEESNVELTTAKKIQVKAGEAFVVAKEEVKRLGALLVKEQIGQVKEREHTWELSDEIHLVHRQLQEDTIQLGLTKIQFVTEYHDSNKYFKDTLDTWAHGFRIVRR